MAWEKQPSGYSTLKNASHRTVFDDVEQTKKQPSVQIPLSKKELTDCFGKFSSKKVSVFPKPMTLPTKESELKKILAKAEKEKKKQEPKAEIFEKLELDAKTEKELQKEERRKAWEERKKTRTSYDNHWKRHFNDKKFSRYKDHRKGVEDKRAFLFGSEETEDVVFNEQESQGFLVPVTAFELLFTFESGTQILVTQFNFDMPDGIYSSYSLIDIFLPPEEEMWTTNFRGSYLQEILRDGYYLDDYIDPADQYDEVDEMGEEYESKFEREQNHKEKRWHKEHDYDFRKHQKHQRSGQLRHLEKK
jgi:hypothetical protein